MWVTFSEGVSFFLQRVTFFLQQVSFFLQRVSFFLHRCHFFCTPVYSISVTSVLLKQVDPAYLVIKNNKIWIVYLCRIEIKLNDYRSPEFLPPLFWYDHPRIFLLMRIRIPSPFGAFALLTYLMNEELFL